MITQQNLESITSTATEWIENHLATQPREVLFAQLLHPAITARRGPAQVERMEEIGKLKPGGLFQGMRSWRELRALFLEASSLCPIPPIVSADYECRVAIEEGISCGTAMNLGAVADLDSAITQAYAVGKTCALQGRAVGTRWTFAPVADLNRNPENPITNVRAFGENPEHCAALVEAFVRGCQDHGMAATLKHFPGDGLDSNDQHVSPAVNPMSLADWEQSCGKPFRAGIAAGAWSVMMGHLVMPALKDRDPVSQRLLPATISPAAHRFLRNDLGFDGVIISDAIGMGGLAWYVENEADAVLRILAAGSDMVLLPDHPAQALRAILHAVDEGILDEQRLLASVRRILILKTRLGLHREDLGLLDEKTSELLFLTPDLESPRRLAEESVTLLRNGGAAYPAQPTPGAKVIVFDLPNETPSGVALVVAGQEEDARLEPAMMPALRERGFNPVWVRTVEDFRVQAAAADAAIYRFHVRPQAGRNSIRLSYQTLQFLEQTREPTGLRRFYVSLGSPYLLQQLPLLPNLAVIYAAVPSCESAFIQAMLGEIPFAGRCPVQGAVPAYL